MSIEAAELKAVLVRFVGAMTGKPSENGSKTESRDVDPDAVTERHYYLDSEFLPPRDA